MKARTWVVTGVALGVMGAAGWGIASILRSAVAADVSEAPVTRVKRGPVAITISARGSLQGGSPEMLYAPQVAQDNLVVTFLRQPGELVSAGDVVAEFDTTQQEYNLREAEADLAEAQQKVSQTEAENRAADEEARWSVESASNAVKLADVQVRKNQLQARLAMRQAEISRESANNRLKQARQDLDSRKTTGAAGLNIQRAAEMRSKTLADMARKNIENMTLKAKARGYVATQPNTMNTFVLTTGMMIPNVQLGDQVRPGMSIAQIFDLDNWVVSAQIPESDRGHLAVGQPVEVAIMALAGKSYKGRVASIGSASGTGLDRTLDCRIALEDADPDLRPGMSSYLTITAEKVENALWLPSQALFDRDGQPFVYLRTGAGFSPKDITLLKRSESQIILTGLNEGDVVALSNPTQEKKGPAKQASASQAISK